MDIQGAMRDCILKLLWPKDDIVEFFKKSGCTKQDISVLGDHKELKRYVIVDRIFSHLNQSPDKGLGKFRAMLQALIAWSHFDSYYFEKLKKLDRREADYAINHLRQLQEIRDHRIKEERKRREDDESKNNYPSKTIEELKQRHIQLIQGASSSQKRGYELEKILLELCRLSTLEVTEPFRIVGEQIDGAVKYDGEHYLLEAKWHEAAASNEPVYQFAAKVEGKMYGRGIFVSINGFSTEVVSALTQSKAIKTIFVDGGDIMMVLEEYLTFAQMIDKKVHAAQTKGHIYIDSISGKSK